MKPTHRAVNEESMRKGIKSTEPSPSRLGSVG